ncbi:hypothetical protein IIF7_09773 [Zunongwangia atlantica 22II14-10F7]|uniref:Uncharacterized protein n=1 Tax=Zunongwangia atlantica 22II14-10F7 TaxID=1185767 RepID=A0A1Y1T382_9FLAO|nr:hypothetical protein IIF7_09773 [Zunongwangia atlantica 22II14-10F7]
MNLKFNKIDLIFKKFQKFYSFYTSQKYTKTYKLQKIQSVGSKLPRGIRWKQIFNFKASLGTLYPLAVPIKKSDHRKLPSDL